MKRIAAMLAWALLLSLPACVEVPPERPEKPDEGTRFDFNIPRTPYTAAICIARNARNRLPNVAAEERLLGESSMEVVVRMLDNPEGTLAVAQIHHDRAGSTVSISILVTPLVPRDREAFARQLVAGC